MPNVKVYVDDSVLARSGSGPEAMLGAIRDFLCKSLNVPESACHIVLLGAISAKGQTPVNVELVVLRKQERTHDAMVALCGQLRDLTAEWTGCQTAVRCAMMEPEHYIVAR